MSSPSYVHIMTLPHTPSTWHLMTMIKITRWVTGLDTETDCVFLYSTPLPHTPLTWHLMTTIKITRWVTGFVTETECVGFIQHDSSTYTINMALNDYNKDYKVSRGLVTETDCVFLYSTPLPHTPLTWHLMTTIKITSWVEVLLQRLSVCFYTWLFHIHHQHGT